MSSSSFSLTQPDCSAHLPNSLLLELLQELWLALLGVLSLKLQLLTNLSRQRSCGNITHLGQRLSGCVSFRAGRLDVLGTARGAETDRARAAEGAVGRERRSEGAARAREGRARVAGVRERRERWAVRRSMFGEVGGGWCGSGGRRRARVIGTLSRSNTAGPEPDSNLDLVNISTHKTGCTVIRWESQ